MTITDAYIIIFRYGLKLVIRIIIVISGMCVTGACYWCRQENIATP